MSLATSFIAYHLHILDPGNLCYLHVSPLLLGSPLRFVVPFVLSSFHRLLTSVHSRFTTVSSAEPVPTEGGVEGTGTSVE